MKKIAASLVLFTALLARGASPPVVFMTDFGLIDDAVAICKGVMLGLAPGLTIVDLTHDVAPFAIGDGARFLAGAAEFYPEGTVFVTVVDPGVGSARKALAAKSKKGHYFVLPDNGLLTLVADRDGLTEVREIQNKKWMLQDQVSSTFHGRDIFSPVAARLARGEKLSDVGPELKTLVRIDVKVPRLTDAGVEGELVGLDGPYGNVITNIRLKDAEKAGIGLNDTVTASLGRRRVTFPLKRTFSDVAVGKPLFYIDSKGFIALAVNQGNFAKDFKVTPPGPITLLKPLKK
jgi:S-adenosyl-L-methionine hydrolase (adenosine-forming)